jgi:hypothetical protein
MESISLTDNNALVLIGKRKTGSRFEFQVRSSPAGAMTEFIDKTVNVDSLISRYQAAAGDDARLQTFGEELGNILFNRNDETYTKLVASYNLIKQAEHPAKKLRIVGEFDAALHAVPWEFTHVNMAGGNPTELGYLALDKHIILVREQLTGQSPTPWPETGRIDMLALVCDPDGGDYASFDKKGVLRTIQGVVDDANAANATRIELCTAQSTDELKRLLDNDRTYHLALVFCHGAYGHEQRQGLLALENKYGELEECRADRFASLLQHRVCSVVMCGCQTGKSSPDLVWSSVANTMLAGGASIVLGMTDSLSESDGMRYCKLLLENLFLKSKNFADAVSSVRWRLREDGSRFFGVPVLYEHGSALGRGLGIRGRSAAVYEDKKDKYIKSRSQLLRSLVRFLNDNPELRGDLREAFEMDGVSTNAADALLEAMQANLVTSVTKLRSIYLDTRIAGKKRILKKFINKFLPLCVERTLFERFLSRHDFYRFSADQRISIDMIESLVAGEKPREVKYETDGTGGAVPFYSLSGHSALPLEGDSRKKWESAIRTKFQMPADTPLNLELSALYLEGTPLFMRFADENSAEKFPIDGIIKVIHESNKVNNDEETLSILMRRLVILISNE